MHLRTFFMWPKILLPTFFLLLRPFFGVAQLYDEFSDGDFRNNPPWNGDSASWIINTSQQLQSAHLVPNSNFQLATPLEVTGAIQWEWYCQLQFNTSGANYADVFLTASGSDFNAAGTTGYFVRIGNTEDEISLYRRQPNGISIKIIDGINGTTNTSNLRVRIKVTRNANGAWRLYRDLSGTGNAYTSEGTVTDTSFTDARFFGLQVRQSTAAFFERHFFDAIEVKPFIPDELPPFIKEVTVPAATRINLLFSEPVEDRSALLLTQYEVSEGIDNPVAAARDLLNHSLVQLELRMPLSTGINYQLIVYGLSDAAGNEMVPQKFVFTYTAPHLPKRNDVVINEIMADPQPPVALPPNEWIELKNTSRFPINLEGWRIGNASGQSGPFRSYVLLPDSFLVVCGTSAAAAMNLYGPTVGVTGFPSPGNTNDQVHLVNAQGAVIHAVSYEVTWYKNELKKEGGWSLEIMDATNPCTGEANWQASTDSRGGTPGTTNASAKRNPDERAPRLLRAYAKDSLRLVLVFDEPMDSSATAAARFNLSDGIGGVTSAEVLPPLFKQVSLQLPTPLSSNKVYVVTASAAHDCVGNPIGTYNSARVGITSHAHANDLVINEILFNPPAAGADYLELYNRGNRILDLHHIYLANRNNSGTISNISRISAEPTLLFPGDFVVVTENLAWLKTAYVTERPEAIVQVGQLPAWNDDHGTVLVLNEQGEIVDELMYTDKWHFKLLANTEGVSLERIDYHGLTQHRDNWHSAAGTVGYGTPGYRNSQYLEPGNTGGTLTVVPEIVSPDNDGQDDFTTIVYQFPEAGYVANITIFDLAGRPVRYLQRNALCGNSGQFRWDGLGEKGQRLATGAYVILGEIFNLKGIRKQFKLPVVVARRY